MISLDNLKTTINAIKCLLNDYPKKKDIPTKLPNPNPLTFTGAVTGSYDGSEALTVEIPSGGGASGAVEIDNETIVKNSDGKLSLKIPYGYPILSYRNATIWETSDTIPMEDGVYIAATFDCKNNLIPGKEYVLSLGGTTYSGIAEEHVLDGEPFIGFGDFGYLETGTFGEESPFLVIFGLNEGGGVYIAQVIFKSSVTVSLVSITGPLLNFTSTSSTMPGSLLVTVAQKEDGTIVASYTSSEITKAIKMGMNVKLHLVNRNYAYLMEDGLRFVWIGTGYASYFWLQDYLHIGASSDPILSMFEIGEDGTVSVSNFSLQTENIYLRSPNRTLYKIAVADGGAISAVSVSE